MHLVSTQLIEAGVDVDFPVVLRELAPLEAIVQSAGRCNREGRLNRSGGIAGGRVVVFRSVEGKLPRGDRWYQAGHDTLVNSFLNAGRQPDVNSPGDMQDYFVRLYATGELDSLKIELLRSQRLFGTVWNGDPDRKSVGRYRLINDDTFPATIATWGKTRACIEDLLERNRNSPSAKVLRELSRYHVNLRNYEMAAYDRLLTTEPGGMCVWRGKYCDVLGLLPEGDDLEMVI